MRMSRAQWHEEYTLPALWDYCRQVRGGGLFDAARDGMRQVEPLRPVESRFTMNRSGLLRSLTRTQSQFSAVSGQG